jgi:hypothetical protein
LAGRALSRCDIEGSVDAELDLPRLLRSGVSRPPGRHAGRQRARRAPRDTRRHAATGAATARARAACSNRPSEQAPDLLAPHELLAEMYVLDPTGWRRRTVPAHHHDSAQTTPSR